MSFGSMKCMPMGHREGRGRRVLEEKKKIEKTMCERDSVYTFLNIK